MDQAQLVNDQIDAGAELATLLKPVTGSDIAFWLRGSENERWRLYLVYDPTNGKNLDQLYEQALHHAAQLSSPNFESEWIKLIPTNNPLAQAAKDIRLRYPNQLPASYRGSNFGGMSVDGVYIYRQDLRTRAATP